MNSWRLVLRSLRFHRRAHLSVLLGAMLSTAILAGALAVGDSVRYSLRQMALSRLGNIQLALHSPARFFRANLADKVSPALGNTPVAPVILLRGTVASEPRENGTGGDVRVGNVQVLGVSEPFWRLGNEAAPRALSGDAEAAILNDRLARKLGAKVGDEVLLRVDKPGLLSRDAPLSTIEDASVTLRVPVAAIIPGARFGRFSLDANQIPPMSVFLSLKTLQNALGMEGRANTLLVGINGKLVEPAAANQALWKHWQFTDAGLEVRDVPDRNAVELRTSRVFLDEPVGQAARQAYPGAQGVLTYFVNELRNGDRATPYSTVAALEGGVIPPGMTDDEILINQWTADDMGAKVGDSVKLTYWVMGPMRRLEEHSRAFRVRAILPMTGPARDPALMPDIPGLSDKKDCREWEPGVPIDLERIRDKDQEYWSAYRGTPKAFITLRAGQRIWNNRFGNLTAVRYPAATPQQTRPTIEMCLRQAVNPASMGLFFTPVREQALAASSPSLDFGQLFLGFSFFLIVAALLLTALLFAFGVEQRAEEVGTLLAVGVPRPLVQRLLLREGGALALVAALLGAGLATVYTQALIRGLSTVWRGAVADAPLQYHAEPATLAGGAASGFLMALLAIYLVTRRQACAPARELLASGGESESRLLSGSRRGRFLPGLPTAIAAFGLALLLTGWAIANGGGSGAAGFFFGAGFLLLLAGVTACRALLAYWERTANTRLSLGSLGMRNSVRRPGRSLGVVALFACGSFLIIAVGANRHDPQEGARKRSSGTGGFALYGESTLPVYEDLNAEKGREEFGLEAEELSGVNILALRLREGDDASCLNLNRAQTPRLFGVGPEEMAKRGAFTFAQKAEMEVTGRSPWTLLDSPQRDGAIPVIGDTNTVVWSLGKKLGDTLPIVDDQGNTRQLRIVGVLANSILQGGLILSESQFTRLFPSHSGYRVFLIDSPSSTADAASRTLTRALEDVGLSLTPAPERMAAFNTVENTYLSIFAALGGLGLLLGSAGLGVIVLRNVLERRGELALLRAVGLPAPALHRLVFSEHALLLALGLGVGIFSALIAVLPALRSPGASVPYLSLSLTLLAVFVSGFAATWAATTFALRAPVLSALRNE